LLLIYFPCREKPYHSQTDNRTVFTRYCFTRYCFYTLPVVCAIEIYTQTATCQSFAALSIYTLHATFRELHFVCAIEFLHECNYP